MLKKIKQTKLTYGLYDSTFPSVVNHDYILHLDG